MSEHLLVGRAVGRGAGRVVRRIVRGVVVVRGVVGLAGKGIVPRGAALAVHRVGGGGRSGGRVGVLHEGIRLPWLLLVLPGRAAQKGDGTGDGGRAELAGAGAEAAGGLVGAPLAGRAQSAEG